MANTQTADIRTLLGGAAGEDRLATAHFLVGALFAVLGGAVAALSLITLRFAGLLPVTYGRLAPIANLLLMIGFAAISLIGGVYYVLPRLTGARLWRPELARLGLAAITGLVLMGTAALVLGLGSGRLPIGLPWWLNIPLLGALSVPLLITLGTIASRLEQRSYVTLWFVIGGVTWLPLLYFTYLIGDLPALRPLTVAYSDLFFSAGFVTMFLFTVGSGLLYYTVVRELDVPLASRQLALVGFWSLGFAAAWWGVAQLIFGPGPGWVSGVAAALGLAFPVGALANAANLSMSLEGTWGRQRDVPWISSGVTGAYLAVGVALLAAFGSFRSMAAVTSLTAYWEAVEYTAILGAGTLLVAATTIPALSRVVGREVYTPERVRTFNRLILIGSVGVLVFLGASGIVSGYSWVGGSNSAAFIDAGEGWGTGWGPAVNGLLLVAVGFALITFLGQLAYASIVFGTLTRGKATTQEVLVPREQADE